MDTSEVRWFARGSAPTDVLKCFAEQSPITEVDERPDTYVLHGIDGLGIKYRDQRILEVKLRHSIGADIVLGPGLQAPLVRWQKWCPEELDEPWLAPDVGRVDVHKIVVKSSLKLIDGALAPIDRHCNGSMPACTVELATVVVEDDAWWTIGLEATGPVEARRRMLVDSWRAVSAGSLPDIGLPAQLDIAAAYPEWLEQHVPYQLAL